MFYIYVIGLIESTIAIIKFVTCFINIFSHVCLNVTLL